MEWSRVKSILICVFLVVNLVLIKVYINGNSTQVVDETTINNTITVLKAKNIIIEKDVIVNKTSDVPVFNITNKHKTTKDFVNVCYSKAKENGFDYFNPDNTEETDGLVIYKGKADNHKTVHKGIKKSGILEGYKYKKNVVKNGNKTTLVYNVYNNGLCVYDSYIKAEVENGTVVITVKNWIGDNYSNAGYNSVLTAPESLISFSNAVAFEKPVRITKMEQGYVAGDRNGELRTTNAVPVWKITCDDGYNYFVDMRNGDYLKL